MKKLSKTRIEYADFAYNPVVGCSSLGCPTKGVCWAKRMNNRFHYIKDFSKPTWIEDNFNAQFPKKSSRILVGFMTDMMRPEISDSIIVSVRNRCRVNPQHTFLWLTKNPIRYKEFEFAICNCWLGTTVNYINNFERIIELATHTKSVRWVSFEPLMEDVSSSLFSCIGFLS